MGWRARSDDLARAHGLYRAVMGWVAGVGCASRRYAHTLCSRHVSPRRDAVRGVGQVLTMGYLRALYGRSTDADGVQPVPPGDADGAGASHDNAFFGCGFVRGFALDS